VAKELEVNKDVFRTELRDSLASCLEDYYENILKMDGTSGIPLSSMFKRKLRSISVNAAAGD
jgi:hypothetical protein